MKKILIGIGVLLVLLVVAVLVGPSFFDWNRYKGEITAKAREATGRDLNIDGDISLSILWTPTLSVKKVRFANIAGGSAPDMATLESLDVRLAFAPLDWIGGKFQVQRIDLEQPTILLERLADGRANWQLERPGSTGSAGGAGGGPDIRLDDIRIAHGTLIYRDAKSGAEQKIESLNAELGATSLRGPFRAGGNLSFQGVPVMFKLDAGALGDAAPAQIAAEIGLAKTDTTFKFSGTVASAPELAVKGRLDLSTRNLALTLDSLVPGTSAGLPVATDKPFQIAGDVGYSAGAGEIQNLTVALDETTATGSVKFTPGTPAKAEAKLGLNRLDLDKLLASMAASAPGGGTASAPAPTQAGGFTLPQDIDASLAVAVAAISYRGGVINDARMVAELADGKVALNEFSAMLPGGSSFKAVGTLAAADGAPKFDGTLAGKSDNLRGLLEWLNLKLPQVPADRLRTLALNSKVTATPGKLGLAGLDLKLDSSTITGAADIALPSAGRTGMAFGAGLHVDQLDLDAYMPPAPKQEGAAAQGKKKGGLPLDSLAPLAGINANLDLGADKLVLNEQTLQGVKLTGTLQNATLTLHEFSVQQFAGGKGMLSGTVTDLAGQPRFDTKFDISAKDAGKAFQFVGLPKTPPGKLGALKLNGTLAGGAKDVAYDMTFSIAGIGANGTAKGKATGLDAGIPRVDTTFDLKAKDAGPLATLAGMTADDAAKLGALGAVSLTGTAASGASDLTYDVAVNLGGVGGAGKFAGKVTGLPDAPNVDTRLDFSAQKPAPLLALAGMAGPQASKLGQVGVAGTINGNADNMRLDLGLQGFGGNAKVAGTVSAPGLAGKPAQQAQPVRFDLAISASHPEFRDLLAALVPGYQPQAGQLGPLALSAKATGSTASAALSDLSLKAGQNSLSGNLKYEQGSVRPFVTTALRGGLVDLTPFSPPGKKGAGGGSGGERWSREPLDLSILQAFDADVDFAADRFISGDTQIDNLQAKLAVRDGTLTITELTGNTYGGAVNLTGTLASRGVPTFKGHVVADKVNIDEVSSSRLVKGPVSFDADLNSSGYSMAEVMNALQGTGKVDGTVTVLGKVEQMVGAAALSVLGQQLTKMTGVQQVQNMTDYINASYQAFVGRPNALNGNFTIARGVLNTQDTSFANDQAKALISGDANLGAWTIGMLVNVFSMQFPDQPCLTVDLLGILDSPTPKPRSGGGCGSNGSASGTGTTAAPFGGLNPQDLFSTIVPGLQGPTGTSQGTGPAAPGDIVPDLSGGQARQSQPGAPDLNAPLAPGAQQEQAPAAPVAGEQAAPAGEQQPGLQPGQGGAEPTAPATEQQARPAKQQQQQQPAADQGATTKKAKDKKNQQAPATPTAPAEQPATQPAPAEQPGAQGVPAEQAAPGTTAPAEQSAPATEQTQPGQQQQQTRPAKQQQQQPAADQGTTTKKAKDKKKKKNQQAPATTQPAPEEQPTVVVPVEPAPQEQQPPAPQEQPAIQEQPGAQGVPQESAPAQPGATEAAPAQQAPGSGESGQPGTETIVPPLQPQQ
ncbi:MAG TPA: AsmA family protein [Candidatus Acidoferrum sp.]|nr:AsmA family protein [Candidatus Acidoferrum sp.]